jgi:proline racemase
MAQLFTKGRLDAGADFVNESLIGTMFECRIEGLGQVGLRPAILPSIAGWARKTGYNTIFVDDRDPLAHGFMVS